MMRCAFLTLGCRLNQYDTQAIREEVLRLGYVEVSPKEEADLLVVNACTVTARAGERSGGMVRKLARRNPGATLLVTGCLTPGDREALSAIPEVRHIVGNEEKDQIPALLQGTPRRRSGRGRRSRGILRLRTSRFHGHTRAFLKVQDGCDDFCTYCIIPFLRGRSRSRPRADVLEEARGLAAAGHREIVLTGIHLRRYGDDLGDRGDGGLPRLLVELRAIRGVDRVRLSSIGAGALSDSFLRLFQEDPGLCPFFHIPLQSGSEAVLARMRRGYAVDDFLGTLERVRQALPHAVIATDLMVGFPGETEEEFEESLELCRRARFAAIHLFPYSLRPGTRAARLPGHLPPELKQARMERARSLAAGLAAEERERWIGRPVRVLVEEHRAGSAAGLSREGLRTRLAAPGAASLWNQEISARVTAADGEGLIARREDRHV